VSIRSCLVSVNQAEQSDGSQEEESGWTAGGRHHRGGESGWESRGGGGRPPPSTAAPFEVKSLARNLLRRSKAETRWLNCASGIGLRIAVRRRDS